MARKRMSINEDSIGKLFTSMNELSADLESGKSELNSSCQIFNTTGLFLEGFKKISDQFSKLSSIATEIGRTARQKSESLFDKEMMLYHLAEDIEIPNELTSVDTIEKSNYQSVTLGKEDGKGVNSTPLSSCVTDIEEPDGKMKSLGNINNGDETKAVSMDEIEGNKIKLSNIKNDNNSEIADINGPDGKRITLGNINNGNETSSVTMDEMKEKKIKLYGINNTNNDASRNVDGDSAVSMNKTEELKTNLFDMNINKNGIDDNNEEDDFFFDDFYG